MKVTILLDYPDTANPKFTGNMTALGGKIEAVHFGDLFAENEPGCYLRCEITGNLCGTDTRRAGDPCQCENCLQWAAS